MDAFGFSIHRSAVESTSGKGARMTVLAISFTRTSNNIRVRIGRKLRAAKQHEWRHGDNNFARIVSMNIAKKKMRQHCGETEEGEDEQ